MLFIFSDNFVHRKENGIVFSVKHKKIKYALACDYCGCPAVPVQTENVGGNGGQRMNKTKGENELLFFFITVLYRPYPAVSKGDENGGENNDNSEQICGRHHLRDCVCNIIGAREIFVWDECGEPIFIKGELIP